MKHVTFTFPNPAILPQYRCKTVFHSSKTTPPCPAQSRNKDRMKISASNRATFHNPQKPIYFHPAQLAQFRNENRIKIGPETVLLSATRTIEITSESPLHRVAEIKPAQITP